MELEEPHVTPAIHMAVSQNWIIEPSDYPDRLHHSLRDDCELERIRTLKNRVCNDVLTSASSTRNTGYHGYVVRPSGTRWRNGIL